ncbi:MAG: hypothetical protein JOZ97_04740 [Candidatus Eremiobacteraeota bacterium]|nr:hypothetical protein [Candidatus Eremiobacteraeota bacterium]
MFEFQRVESLSQLPPPDARFIDVALLDMNHRWLNVGHESIVRAVRSLSEELAGMHQDVRVRLFSFDVRDRMIVPQHDGRFELYVGTGGPGHLDPRENLGRGEAEIEEDASWEAPVFALFDAIRDDQDAALVGVCHTFGLLCRWSGVAQPMLRGAELLGKSIGVQHNVLTEAALAHPWFSRLAESVGTHVPVVDHRYYDLVASNGVPRGTTVIGYESDMAGRQSVVTMVEFARNEGDPVPRIFGSNHHPEIPNVQDLGALLDDKLKTGEVTREWYDSRAIVITVLQRDDHDERARLLTSEYTFTGILRVQLERLIARRAARHGRTVSAAL